MLAYPAEATLQLLKALKLANALESSVLSRKQILHADA